MTLDPTAVAWIDPPIASVLPEWPAFARRMLVALLAPMVVSACSADAVSDRVVILAADEAQAIEGDQNLQERPPTAVLQAGVGFDRVAEHRWIVYFRFPIAALPPSRALTTTVVESAYVSLLAQSAVYEQRFLAAVSSCGENLWTSPLITWSDRPCPESAVGQDAVIILAEELPSVFQWDVSGAVSTAHAAEVPTITLMLDAYALPAGTGIRSAVPGEAFGPSGDELGLLRFWGRGTAGLSRSTAPRLVVSTRTSPNAIHTFLTLTLPSFATLISLAGALYGTIRWLGPRASRSGSA